MCDFCYENQREKEQAELGAQAVVSALKALAHQYDLMRQHKLAPHTVEWAKNKTLANHLIRQLVNDWI